MNITKESFGTVEGVNVDLFTLTNDKKVEVKITNYGGIVTQFFAPDKHGNFENIVLGFDNLSSYVNDHPYFGAIIGRFGNRIANGKFALEGKTYELEINNGPNHLHGGSIGFHKQIWEASADRSNDCVLLKLHRISRHMEAGYPGNLDVTVEYKLTNENEFSIEYFAETDQTTHINLTQHNYYNLNGCKKNIVDHIVEIRAENYTELGESSIPTGRIFEVENTPFDFRKPKAIHEVIDKIDGGIDHNFVLDGPSGDLRKVAEVYDPDSGRLMEVKTTEPGVQFYTGNFLDGSITGTDGIQYQKHFGLCLETQHFPNSPNIPHFPSTILTPGNKYHHLTVYRFGTK